MDTPVTAGAYLRQLRRHAKLSQLDLALITGVSQRHLSCLETGRAKPSPGTPHNLLTALEVPLDECNRVFLAAGFAPRYTATPLAAPGMAAIREAVSHVLHANNPAPAILLGSEWQVLAANASTAVLFELVGIPPQASDGLNLLATLLEPCGLGDHLINADEIRTLAWQRASREALGNPTLAALLASLPAPASTERSEALPPLVLTRVRSTRGELNFLSTFTTFGMPQDITLASLRIEHLIPADDATWQVMRGAHADYAALVL
ncbi:XRE family transcriptional regulator [Pseudomonas aylmerensis]|uniref:Transcriptional regulator n=1 Tax=Pseudomonas aylmerensis TaxID=1869229 RepID=A0A2T4FYM3_9PSED|nr:helix-turn-helix domain-containing protein [Pseudomonas aylmerensis]OCW21267.1 transcriptional regulator [Pseudomonas aylmerensis]PTC28503.1 XRE family transcriptional regulator [Pseudomonas aylmerensis]